MCGNCGRVTRTGRGICEPCWKWRLSFDSVVLTPFGQAYVEARRAQRGGVSLDIR